MSMIRETMTRFDVYNTFWDCHASRLHTTSQAVWCALYRHADKRGISTVNRPRLARIMGVTERSISRAIDELKRAGLLEKSTGHGYVLCFHSDTSVTEQGHQCHCDTSVTVTPVSLGCDIDVTVQGHQCHQTVTPASLITEQNIYTESLLQSDPEVCTDVPPDWLEDYRDWQEQNEEYNQFQADLIPVEAAPPAPTKKPRAQAIPDEDVQAVMDTWNQYATLPKTRGCTDKRARAIRAILKDKTTAELWRESIAKIANSPHHTGRNKSNWRASFDWWCRVEKVLAFAEREDAPGCGRHVNIPTVAPVIYLSEAELTAKTGLPADHYTVWKRYQNQRWEWAVGEDPPWID